MKLLLLLLFISFVIAMLLRDGGPAYDPVDPDVSGSMSGPGNH